MPYFRDEGYSSFCASPIDVVVLLFFMEWSRDHCTNPAENFSR